MAESMLTAREQQVLRLVGEGKTNREIAAALRISAWTVANHRKHICAKLGVHSTAGLVACGAGVMALEETPPAAPSVECAVKIDLPHPRGRLRFTYRGLLGQTPEVVEVRIGKKVFRF